MIEAMVRLAPPALAGVLFGLVYFGALWWTVRRVLGSQRGAAWLLASAALRIAVLLFGFYAVMDGSWERLVACLVGFVVARVGVNAVVRTAAPLLRANH